MPAGGELREPQRVLVGAQLVDHRLGLFALSEIEQDGRKGRLVDTVIRLGRCDRLPTLAGKVLVTHHCFKAQPSLAELLVAPRESLARAGDLEGFGLAVVGAERVDVLDDQAWVIRQHVDRRGVLLDALGERAVGDEQACEELPRWKTRIFRSN